MSITRVFDKSPRAQAHLHFANGGNENPFMMRSLGYHPFDEALTNFDVANHIGNPIRSPH
jgi:hypothetical protein